ncbi:hypothetical protein D3C80_1559540 [compost metagenome]
MAEANHIAAFGAVCGLSCFLGCLQRGICFAVCGYFLEQQCVLARRFFFCDHAAVMSEDQKPADDAGNNSKNKKHDEDGAVHDIGSFRRCCGHLMGNQGQNAAKGCNGQCC